MQEVVSGCLVQVDFQYYCSQGIFHLSELAGWTIAAPVSEKWNYIGFVQEFFVVVVVVVFFFLEKLSPTSTLVRICGSGRIVWIKCEIPIINVGNHLDGQLWQLQSPLSQVWKDSNIPSPIKTLDHHKSNNINLLNSHRMPCFVKTFILFILFYLPH